MLLKYKFIQSPHLLYVSSIIVYHDDPQFKQFSRTIADAALAQQEGISDGFKSIATIMSAYSSTNNVTWPFLSIPKFEHYAENVRKQAGMEILTYFPKVEADLKDAYLEYVSENYQATVKEGHITQTGSLDRLVDPGNKSYHPYISTPTLEGEMVPDKERDTYWPMWEFSPPPATYGFINWSKFCRLYRN